MTLRIICVALLIGAAIAMPMEEDAEKVPEDEPEFEDESALTVLPKVNDKPTVEDEPVDDARRPCKRHCRRGGDETALKDAPAGKDAPTVEDEPAADPLHS